MSRVLKDCSGVILAGGENRRMPVLKGFIEVRGESIIQRNTDLLRRLFSETFIVTNQPGTYAALNTVMLGDAYDIRGPMTGVFTALLNSSYKWIFVSACDMPFINEELIRFLASRREDCDAVLPETSPGPVQTRSGKGKRRVSEPLFAFYSVKLLKSMETELAQGNRSLKDFLDRKRVQYVTQQEIKKIDAAEDSFINLNTPQDIERCLHPDDVVRYQSRAGRRGTCLV